MTMLDAAHSGSGGSAAVLNPDDDRDRDGICDVTEAALTTDPDRVDTDRDGLPDFTEVNANFDATNPMIPGLDAVAYLSAASANTIEFEARMTVDGSGLGYTGEFRTREAFDPNGLTAKDFYQGAVAIGGQPTDNVRGVQAESERFESVLGRTRVAFQLRFGIGVVKPANCSFGYPFEYRLKDDNGRFTATRDYLLIVTPDSDARGQHKYCLPAACL
jgi:hypothetical protein